MPLTRVLPTCFRTLNAIRPYKPVYDRPRAAIIREVVLAGSEEKREHDRDPRDTGLVRLGDQEQFPSAYAKATQIFGQGLRGARARL